MSGGRSPSQHRLLPPWIVGHSPCANSSVPNRPCRPEVGTAPADMKLVNPANKRKFNVIVVGTGLAGGVGRGDAGRAGLQREVLLLPGQPAPRALASPPRAASTPPRTTRTTATASTGCSTTRSRAATSAPAKPTSIASPKSASTSSTSASRRACRSPANTAACSPTAPSAARRSRAPSTPRPDRPAAAARRLSGAVPADRRRAR